MKVSSSFLVVATILLCITTTCLARPVVDTTKQQQEDSSAAAAVSQIDPNWFWFLPPFWRWHHHFPIHSPAPHSAPHTHPKLPHLKWPFPSHTTHPKWPFPSHTTHPKWPFPHHSFPHFPKGPHMTTTTSSLGLESAADEMNAASAAAVTDKCWSPLSQSEIDNCVSDIASAFTSGEVKMKAACCSAIKNMEKECQDSTLGSYANQRFTSAVTDYCSAI